MTFKKVVAWLEAFAVAAAAVFVIMLFAGGGGGGGGSSSAGARIFSANCARCHGADGEGGIGPVLANVVEQRYPEVEDEIAVVEGGRGTMPSFGGDLSDQQIQQVVDYTRSELGG